eukprot:scaffold8030_cov417-Prasinococcus_capsulatus_cf.AAC.3
MLPTALMQTPASSSLALHGPGEAALKHAHGVDREQNGVVLQDGVDVDALRREQVHGGHVGGGASQVHADKCQTPFLLQLP